NDELYHPSYRPEVIDELKKIAYINIKKTGGGSKASELEIQEYYDYSKGLLFDQILGFNANIIIFGGTFKYFRHDLNLNKWQNFKSCNASIKEGCLYIDAYHPGWWKISEEVYFTDILNAVHHFNKIK